MFRPTPNCCAILHKIDVPSYTKLVCHSAWDCIRRGGRTAPPAARLSRPMMPSHFGFSSAWSRRQGSGDRVQETKVKWLRGGLVVKAHRLFNHSNVGSRVTKKKKRSSRDRVQRRRRSWERGGQAPHTCRDSGDTTPCRMTGGAGLYLLIADATV
jgi:hypothetical protein